MVTHEAVKSRLRIGIPAVGGEGWIGGAIYVDNLIGALRSLDDDEQPAITLVSEPGSHGSVSPSPNYAYLRVRVSPIARALSRVPRAERLAVATYAREYGDQLGHRIDALFPCQHEYQAKALPTAIAWIPDFQHVHLPQYFSKQELAERRDSFSALAQSASVVILSSRDALADFTAHFPRQAQKARVLSFATVPGDTWFEDDPRAVGERYRLPERYVIVANQFWMHKNHRCVIDALAILVSRGVPMHVVCTGATSDYRNPRYFHEIETLVKHKGVESYVHILGLIPREDQIQLVRRAAAVVQPSLFEGWSTVLEDARALGKLAFASDIAVHREQDVNQAVYFDPHDPESLANALERRSSDLTPGPDLAAESQAGMAQHHRIESFARKFLRIADEVRTTSQPGVTLQRD